MRAISTTKLASRMALRQAGKCVGRAAGGSTNFEVLGLIPYGAGGLPIEIIEFREDGLVLGFRPRQGEILAGGNRPPQTTVHYDEERGELVLRFYEVENGLPADVTSDGTVCVQALPAGEPPDMAPLLVKTYGSERGTWPTGRRCGCACNFRPTPTTTSSPAGLSQAATATFSCSPSGLARAPVNTML